MEVWHQVLQQLINGISLGSIYALIALGYTMIYGIIKLINFAHGDIYMVGAYIGFFAITQAHLSVVPALLISLVVTGFLGMLVERLAYKPLRHAPRISVLITAIGVSFFLEYTTMYFVSPTPRTFPAMFGDVAVTVGGIVINGQQMLILGITAVLMVILTYIVQKTKTGKAMRAASFDTETAELMGINSDRIISITFGIGSALAAVAGVLVGIYYNSIDPLMGIMPGLKAFVAAVLGGIGILPGAVVGGLILGVVEALVSGFISSTFRDAAAFAILILVLLVRPAGHDDSQVCLARAGRPDAERDGIVADRVEIEALAERLRAYVAAARGHEDRVAEERMQCLALAAAHETDAVADLMHRDRRALAVEILELFDERRCHLHLSGFAEDLELLAATDELAVKILAEHLQEFIPVPEKCICFFMVFKDNLSFQCLLQRNTSPASFHYIEIKLPI